MFSLPAVEPRVGRPAWHAAGTFGRRYASVAGFAAGAAVGAVGVAASAAHRLPAACVAAEAGPN